MNTDYWAFCKAIYESPLDSTPRLVFADWLFEHVMLKAEKKQREQARILQKVLWYSEIGESKHLFAQNNRGEVRRYRIKMDGYMKAECIVNQPQIDNFMRNYKRNPDDQTLRFIKFVNIELLERVCAI